jgi:hypothetical protein
MIWTSPSFEEINMDAEARGYGMWVSELEAQAAAAESQQPDVARDEARATDG